MNLSGLRCLVQPKSFSSRLNKMKYFFVLGRNPELSKAEIFSYFEREKIDIKNSLTKSNGLLVEVCENVNVDLKKMLSELGGTIAAGKVLISGNSERFILDIKNNPIYFGRENKVIYSVLSYANEEDLSDVLDAMDENFKKERLKARYKGVSGTIKMQSGEVARGSPTKIMLRDMNYFLFGESELSFGYLEESYNVEDAEKKDMEKPYRRESLAISPRLARIMINLSQVEKGGILLDPFCGIGVILGESLLREINVIGVDFDKNATENAKKNIDWLRKEYRAEARAIVINKDSRNVRIDKADGIATEPSLGELMTKIPSRDRAEKTIFEFENLIIGVLNNVKKGLKKNSKIAFSSPLIKSQGGRVSCDMLRICEETRLKIHTLKGSGISFPIREFRPDQIFGREIVVLTV